MGEDLAELAQWESHKIQDEARPVSNRRELIMCQAVELPSQSGIMLTSSCNHYLRHPDCR